MASKKDLQLSSEKETQSSKQYQGTDFTGIDELIKKTMASEMESLQETVAIMLKDSLEKALDPIQKHMAENGNIHFVGHRGR